MAAGDRYKYITRISFDSMNVYLSRESLLFPARVTSLLNQKEKRTQRTSSESSRLPRLSLFSRGDVSSFFLRHELDAHAVARRT